MENNTLKTLLDKDYASKIKELVQLLINDDEPAKAFRLRETLSRAVDENVLKLREDLATYNFYKQKIIELRFLSFSFSDEKNEVALLKDNLLLSFNLEGFDLLTQIKRKLIGVILVGDRDLLKISFIKALSENNEKIVSNNKFKTVRDWLQDYRVNAGSDSLSRAQYLSNLKLDKNINDQERDNLLSLFKLYDFLNIPSSSPWGVEEEPAIIQDGKLSIFRKGILEPINENKNIDEAMRLVEESESGKTEATIKNSSPESKPEPAFEPTPLSPAAELEQTLKNYSESSFEYKALKQEISRLKKSELTKAQHDAKE